MTVEPVTPVRPSPEICAATPGKPAEPAGSVMSYEAGLFVADLDAWGSQGWRIIERERKRRCAGLQEHTRNGSHKF